MQTLFTAFALVFVAEMGDKTQLFLVGLSSRYKTKTIALSIAAAIAILNGAAVALGFLVGGSIDAKYIKCAAALAFLAFAYVSLLPKGEEEERSSGKSAFAAIFLSFLLAELGDKTQLMTFTLAANERAAGGGIAGAAMIFIGCSVGLFAADMIGLAAGAFLAKRLPDSVFTAISFVIFTLFGIYTAYEASSAIFNSALLPVVITISSVTLVFAALCGVTLYKLKRRGGKNAEDGNENK
ncbi:MAG: TMEM165/GDT1 family protein [Clostridia bacterium]|nr:TMEM165/GDT1 family protein [Clostridia bacterium]